MAKAQRRKASTQTSTPSSEHSTTAPVMELDVTTRDLSGRTPLHQAARYGYVTTVQRMLVQHAEVDARDDMERTPGHWSAFKGYLEIVKLLVEHGADINARDTGGRTWLAMAIIGKQTTTEAFLRMRGGTM